MRLPHLVPEMKVKEDGEADRERILVRQVAATGVQMSVRMTTHASTGCHTETGQVLSLISNKEHRLAYLTCSRLLHLVDQYHLHAHLRLLRHQHLLVKMSALSRHSKPEVGANQARGQSRHTMTSEVVRVKGLLAMYLKSRVRCRMICRPLTLSGDTCELLKKRVKNVHQHLHRC